MQNTREAGSSRPRGRWGRNMHAYQSVDPFAASVYQSIQNTRAGPGIQSIDDIGPPSAPSHPPIRHYRFNSAHPQRPIPSPGIQPTFQSGWPGPPNQYGPPPPLAHPTVIPLPAQQPITPFYYGPPTSAPPGRTDIPSTQPAQSPPIIVPAQPVQPLIVPASNHYSGLSYRAYSSRSRRTRRSSSRSRERPMMPLPASYDPHPHTVTRFHRRRSYSRHSRSRSPSRHRSRSPMYRRASRRSRTPESRHSTRTPRESRSDSGSPNPSKSRSASLSRSSRSHQSRTPDHVVVAPSQTPQSHRPQSQRTGRSSRSHSHATSPTPVTLELAYSQPEVRRDDQPASPVRSDAHEAPPVVIVRPPERRNSPASPERPPSRVQSEPILATVSPAPTIQSHSSDVKTEYELMSSVGTPDLSVPSLQPDEESIALRHYAKAFLCDTLPRQIYLHCLLRLPYLYFSRVDRIFQEADLTLEEIKEMALQATAEDHKTFQDNLVNYGYYYYEGTSLSPTYLRLKTGWEHFIDNLMREWKTLNIISALLLSGILTMFQIDGASGDPVTRYLAFWSLICALLSLLYGCLFIIRFSTMRKAYKAAEWALEARKHQTIFWNVWVMLSMPVIWLSWSIITYIVCIMSFMWRAKANLPPDYVFSVAPSTELGFRVFVCFVLGVGITYGMLIINTFRHYGSNMEEAWRRRVQGFIAQSAAQPAYSQPLPPPQYQQASPIIIRGSPRHSRSSHRPPSSSSDPLSYVVAGIVPRSLRAASSSPSPATAPSAPRRYREHPPLSRSRSPPRRYRGYSPPPRSRTPPRRYYSPPIIIPRPISPQPASQSNVLEPQWDDSTPRLRQSYYRTPPRRDNSTRPRSRQSYSRSPPRRDNSTRPRSRQSYSRSPPRQDNSTRLRSCQSYSRSPPHVISTPDLDSDDDGVERGRTLRRIRSRQMSRTRSRSYTPIPVVMPGFPGTVVFKPGSPIRLATVEPVLSESEVILGDSHLILPEKEARDQGTTEFSPGSTATGAATSDPQQEPDIDDDHAATETLGIDTSRPVRDETVEDPGGVGAGYRDNNNSSSDFLASNNIKTNPSVSDVPHTRATT